MTQQIATKIAPAYNGKTSFFVFEAEKRKPALRNRLEGDAAQYKRLLGRKILRDPIKGESYFKTFPRHHYIKIA